MKLNVCLTSTLRKPLSALMLFILIGLVSFGFITKSVEFILVQRQTTILGGFYRSIGILQNINDPVSGDISAGIDLIEDSPDFAYGDQRELASGIMPKTYNANGPYELSNSTYLINTLPREYWYNVHATDLWFSGELTDVAEVKTKSKLPQDQKTIGYYLGFKIDTLLAAYPEDAQQGQSIGLIFLFEGNEAAIPTIQAMTVGQRYFIHGWKDYPYIDPYSLLNANGVIRQIIPLDGQSLWYLPLAKDASIDFSTPKMAAIKNEIDVLNENLHTLTIIATADMSAMPRMQETSNFYYLVEGRWLNHEDDLAQNKVIVISQEFAGMRGYKLGDKITLTFRPLKDTFYGYIRDGIDTLEWRSYPTYQDTFEIVGIYRLKDEGTIYAYIPASTLRPGFDSATQIQFRDEANYSFVLKSSRDETRFTQEFKDRLQALGISLTFLPNNGPAYWAAVDPIRRSSSADALVFGLVMAVALVMAVFLYNMSHRRDYAILRALGVPIRQANGQLVLPLLLLGGLGILVGGLSSWNYALGQAQKTLSTLPIPAGITPSSNISPLFLVGLGLVIFLLLTFLSWLGAIFMAHRPVFELLQGQWTQVAGTQRQKGTHSLSQAIPFVSSQTVPVHREASAATPVILNLQRNYKPSFLIRYVIQHIFRSKLKSLLTLTIALGFMLALAWIWQTLERSRAEVDRLYDTTIVEADIVKADPSAEPPIGTIASGSGVVYLKTVDGVLNSGYMIGSVLESDTIWDTLETLDSHEVFTGPYLVQAYDSPATLESALAEPGTLTFASGWDISIFARQWTLGEIQTGGFPALFPTDLLKQLQLKVGEMVQITDSFNNSYMCIIAGQYSGGTAVTIAGVKSRTFGAVPVLIPLSAMESMERSKTTFTLTHFTIDPKWNRDLSQVQTDMDKVVNDYEAGTTKLRFIIWDEELRLVVGQLEKNIALLQVLYPVVMAISVLIGAGLCFLLLQQNAREAAILRMLGTTRTAVRLTLILEPLSLSLIGVILGLGISQLLWVTSGFVAVPLLIPASAYLVGTLAGLVLGAFSVTNKQPIELLQVKE